MHINDAFNAALESTLNDSTEPFTDPDFYWQEIKENMRILRIDRIILKKTLYDRLGGHAFACKHGAIWIEEKPETGEMDLVLPVEP